MPKSKPCIYKNKFPKFKKALYNIYMPIITNTTTISGRYRFIFIEDNIVLKKCLHSFPLSEEDLPNKEIAQKCLQTQMANDWYEEPELNYSAILLEKDCPVPSGCEVIPLRQFFWDSKTEDEQKKGLPSMLGGLAARAHGFLRLRETYRYCPKCGSLLQVDKTFTAKVCPTCGRQDFPRIEPAIIVLVRKGSQLLLAKSKTTHSSAYYSCIAGFVEHGETLEQCVEREVLEETGIHIQNIRYVGSQAWPYPDQLMLAFRADYKSGEIAIQEEEIEDATWFEESSLPPIPRPGSVAYNLIKGIF